MNPNIGDGAQALSVAFRVLCHGVPVAHHKTEGPATLVIFRIDIKAFELRLPSDKVQRLHSLLQAWSRVTAWPPVPFARVGLFSASYSTCFTFLRGLSALILGARADLAWWRCFFQNWNGSSCFPPPVLATHVHSDASGSYGCGSLR